MPPLWAQTASQTCVPELQSPNVVPTPPYPPPRSPLQRWYKIPDECALAHLLRAPGYVVPGVPVIKVVARDTAFHESFVSALEGSETVLEPTAEIRAAPLDP